MSELCPNHDYCNCLTDAIGEVGALEAQVAELTAERDAAWRAAQEAREALAEFVAERYPGQSPKPWTYSRRDKLVWNATGQAVVSGVDIGPKLGALIVKWFTDPKKEK